MMGWIVEVVSLYEGVTGKVAEAMETMKLNESEKLIGKPAPCGLLN